MQAYLIYGDKMTEQGIKDKIAEILKQYPSITPKAKIQLSKDILALQEDNIMGNWKTLSGITISDDYADSIEGIMDKMAEEFKSAHPHATEEQFKQTVKFVLGRKYPAYEGDTSVPAPAHRG